jgi:hypothetical protein
MPTYKHIPLWFSYNKQINSYKLSVCTAIGYNVMKINWITISWRTNPLLGNDSVKTFPREPTCAKIGRLLLGYGSLHTPKTKRDNRKRCFPWGPSQDEWEVPRKQLSEVERVQLKKNSFESIVVENLVELQRWQSKVTEKKLQERKYTATRRLHVWFEVTVRLLLLPGYG